MRSSEKAQGGARDRRAGRWALSAPRTAAATWLVCNCQGRAGTVAFYMIRDLGDEMGRREAEDIWVGGEKRREKQMTQEALSL